MLKLRSLPLTVLLLMAGMLTGRPNTAVLAEEVSHASEIVQYVKEDKVYLLEKIRGQLTKPSEKLVVEALLTEDGPQASALYREQLEKYPDPQLDQISRARLKAYEQAVATSAGLPVMPVKGSVAPKPVATAAPLTAKTNSNAPTAAAPASVVPKPGAPVASDGPFTLQFGSFDSITNADQLVAQLAPKAPSSVRLINGIYKVRMNRTFNSRQEAAAFGRTMPIESIVVPAQP